VARAKNKDVGAARDALVSPLRTFAGERAAESEALATATGVIDPDDRLGESLTDLAALARTWLALTDDDSIVLASKADLTADLAITALDAAKALTGSAADAKLEGYVAGKDTPLINLGVLCQTGETTAKAPRTPRRPRFFCSFPTLASLAVKSGARSV
jgi:hypothetical protein